MEDLDGNIGYNLNQISNYSNNIQNFAYSMDIGKPNKSIEESLKEKDDKIKSLQRKLKSYQKKNLLQNQKISSKDNLYIEYNSLNKNYAELENELNSLKAENAKLQESLINKNNIICEYEKAIEATSNKFQLYNETEKNLLLKNKENESKLKMLPDLMQNNTELSEKLNGFENKIESLKDENNKKEELFKVKFSNQEKNHKKQNRIYEDEISELRIELERLKTELGNSKQKNEELTSKVYIRDNDFNKKYLNSQKQSEKLAKTILQLQDTINENCLSHKEEVQNDQKTIQQLQDEINNLNNNIKNRDDQITMLNEAIVEFDNAMKASEDELINRENIILGITEEKDKILALLNSKQNDFLDYQNSSQQEINILHQKLLILDREKNNLSTNQTTNKDQLSLLKEQINQYEINNKNHQDKCLQIDKQYNDLLRAFEIKEKEYNDELNKLTQMNKNEQNEFEIMKAKYEKKIQMLSLNNKELNSRVKNLINSLIALKNYAMTIERNLNDPNLNLNNSMYTTIGYSNNNNVRRNQELVRGMKDLISKIDSNMLNSNINYQSNL